MQTVEQRLCEFGFPGSLRDRLVAAVLNGTKTATSSLRAEWDAEGEELPLPGVRETVIDSAGRSVAIIEIVAVDVIKLADADDRLAVAEGENYTTAAGWREEHERFWRDEVLPVWPSGTPPSIDENTQVVVQWFRLADPASSLFLRPLTVVDEAEARQAHHELAENGFDFLLVERPGEAWSDYVERLEQMRHGRGLARGQVPATFLVADVNGKIVGRLSLRHELNAELAEIGGHIGYGVRPRFRRRGHATEIFRQALLIARAAGVKTALITCDENNAASRTIIEAGGGKFDRLTIDGAASPPKRRYWIST